MDFMVYAFGYANVFKWYEKYRINEGVQRAWENNPKWPQERLRLFYYLGLNYLLVYPGMLFLSMKLSGIRLRFESEPSM
jgi:hypothetical protein